MEDIDEEENGELQVEHFCTLGPTVSDLQPRLYPETSGRSVRPKNVASLSRPDEQSLVAGAAAVDSRPASWRVLKRRRLGHLISNEIAASAIRDDAGTS